MPIISSTYRPPWWMPGAHIETIMPSMIRKPARVDYQRKRITTRDGDFLDLDFVYNNKPKIAILSHGLEGNSSKNYMVGMAAALSCEGWDVLSWNCRSCSGEMNNTPKLYHHGATEDLADVVKYVQKNNYDQMLLVGFSLGGSLVIKYLGEHGDKVPRQVVGGVAFSVPCDLGACARYLFESQNEIYLNRFLGKLKMKIKSKAIQFPELFDVEGIDEIDSFEKFDSRFTAPLYDFSSADEFYKYASAGQYIKGISVPTLLVNAQNDPMFPDVCYPVDQSQHHKSLYLEMPKRGGHMGFWWPGQKRSWAEKRVVQFVKEVIGIPRL